MGTRTDKPDAGELTDTDLEKLLDLPETPEEKAALDRMAQDPAEILQRARERLAMRLGRRQPHKPDEPPKL